MSRDSGGGAGGRTAIQPTRAQDYAQWYQSVVRDADVAEMSHVRGCMVVKPWGYGIWERLQQILDGFIKGAGARNAYFPLFIPLSYIEREAKHVEGFAKEMAVVTHHRLEVHEGRLVPTAELAEPLVVRPTSETIIGESFSDWIQSYRDLPLRINQWGNAVRWELRPRVLLRTSEFLWQEGHTAHASEAEAVDETHKMLEIYRALAEEHLAIPVMRGEKTPGERFPGAERTFTIEAMMQDGRALQAGTSHYLGQNFARAFNIRFLNAEGTESHAFTTSWGVSTRLVGALVMTHGDDNGLRVPPRVAPHQVVVVPMLRKGGSDEVMAYARELAEQLRAHTFAGGRPVDVHLDDSLHDSRSKKWRWVRSGVPVLVELGPRDLAAGKVSFLPRHEPVDAYRSMDRGEFVAGIGDLLDSIQDHYLRTAREHMESRIRRDVEDLEGLQRHFEVEEGETGAATQPGWVLAKLCEDPACEERVKAFSVSIRCIPFEQSGTSGRCAVCGGAAERDAVYARAY